MKNAKKKPTVGSRIVNRLQEFAQALEESGELAERFTCRQMALDLEPTSYTPKQIQEMRDLLGVSQAIFARFLGVSVKTVRAWEQGVNQPATIARRFMDEIRSNPGYWMERLKQAVVQK